METTSLLTGHDTDRSWRIELQRLPSPTLHLDDALELHDDRLPRHASTSGGTENKPENVARTLVDSSAGDDASLAPSAVGSRPTSLVDNYSLISSAIQHSPHQDRLLLEPASGPVTTVYWTSAWLRKRTLLALAALFTSLTASLIVVWIANRSQNGFRPVLSKNHYAWTYGPTAVLVVVLTLWRQVDYHCKLMQPWQELRNGPADAERSMLLDYLSPLNITSFVRAVRYRHAPVAASIAGFAILKLVIVLSTGLLTLAPVSVTESHPVTLTTAFDGQLIWGTIPTSNYVWATESPNGEYVVDTLSKSGSLYHNISISPVHAYVKDLREKSMDSAGIVDGATIQQFESAAVYDLRSISLEVDAFFPNVSCEVAKPTLSMHPNDEIVVQLDAPTCSVGAQHQSAIEVPPPWPLNATAIYNMWRVNCSEENAEEKYTILDARTPHDFRFAMLVLDVDQLNLTYHEKNKSLNTLVPARSAAVICKIDYSMHRSAVLRNFTDESLSLQPLHPIPKISNFTGIMLGEMINSAVAESGFDLENPDSRASPLFSILMETLGGDKAMERLFAIEDLRSSASQALAGIGTYFVRESYMKPVSIEANGRAVSVEDRLLLGAASFWSMLVGLGLVITLVFCIIFTTLQNVVPRDPGLISSDAMVLFSSPAVQKLLRSCHGMRTSEMTDCLRGIRFRAVVNESFQVDLTCDEDRQDVGEVKPKSSSWIPLPARYYMIFLTLALPLVAIIALEVLYRISRTYDGFADVSGSENTATYLSRYGSALVMLLVATCFNSLDFTAAVFAPYSCLKSGPVPASRGVCLQILGSLPPIALFRSIRGRHAGSFLSNLAGMIGSLLTIVASGLWVIDQAVVVEQAATASLSSAWNITWSNSSVSGDAGAGNVFDQIQHGSASMPASVFQNIVLPDITDIRHQLGRNPVLGSQNFTIQVDGLRPVLSCEVVDDEHITIEFTEGQNSFQRNVYVRVFPSLPIECQYGEAGSNDGNLNFTSNHWFTGGNETTYMGSFYDLHLGPSIPKTSEGYGEYRFDGKWAPDNPAGCPSIGALFAAISRYDVSHDDIVAVVCSQKVQQVRVNATYTGSDLIDPLLNTRQPPLVLESSAQNLTNGTEGFDAFPYRVQKYLQDRDDGGSLTRFTYNGSDWRGPASPLDRFMNHLIFGPNGTTPNDMLGEHNQHTFIKAMSNLYTKYMCLVIDMRFRQPVAEETNAEGRGDGTLVLGTAYSFSSRIKVNATSKLVIQIMLSVMTLLGFLAFLLADLRGTLPRKPTSIASRMALLAGSDLCGERSGPLRDAMGKSEQDFARAFDGWFFSLGWWKRSEMSGDRQAGETVPEDPFESRERRSSILGRFGIDVGMPEQLGFRKRKRFASIRHPRSDEAMHTQ